MMEAATGEIQPTDLNSKKDQYIIIDVRNEYEYNGELGHIPGAKQVTLGPDLEAYLDKLAPKDKPHVFVCRTGGRSDAAMHVASDMGVKAAYSLSGGMNAWNDAKLEISRDAQ